jgi:heat-inducible transcriptional repressor
MKGLKLSGHRKAMILETIIVEYLRSPNPVGSEQLKQRSLGEISSATIRKYFKELLDEGYLTQYHISGGRVPTQQAFEHYWMTHFANFESIDVPSLAFLEECSQAYNISTIATIGEVNLLLGIAKVDEMLALLFSSGTKWMEFDKMVFDFLEQFIGLSVDELRKVALSLHISPLIELLSQTENHKNHHFSYMQEDFFTIASREVAWGNWVIDQILNGRMAQLDQQLYFDDIVPVGVMALNIDVLIESKRAKLVCLGGISQNFNGFLSTLRSNYGAR